MENSLENAIRLYEAGNYRATVEMCGELMNEKENLSSVLLTLAAKSFFFCMSTPLKKEMHETLYLTIGNACRYAKDIREVEQIRYEVEKARRAWKVKCVKDFFENFKSEPSAELWKAYIQYEVNFSEIALFIALQIASCPLKKAIKEHADFNEEEYNQKYVIPLSEDTTGQEISLIEYEAAQQIFTQTQVFLNENNSGTPDFMKIVSGKATMGFGLSDLIFSNVKNSKYIDENTKCACIKQSIDCHLAFLAATVYPNGQAVSLISTSDQRKEYIDEINELVKEIQLLDPTYQLPSQPNPTPLQPAQPQSSGGCYVATCVYGSYDCPEVWTLRRFRDNTLGATWYGKLFIRVYYTISPTLVKWFGKTKWFKNMWKGTLDHMVKKLEDHGFENTPYEDKKW